MKRSFLIIFLLCLVNMIYAQDQSLIPYGSVWKYLDDGSNQGTTWRGSAFNDASWASGPSELGYGDGDEATIVSFGPSSSAKYMTTYFRHSFNIADVSVFKNFLVKLKRDDGALVYVNGSDVMRSNFGTGTYSYTDDAYATISTSEEEIIYEELIDPSFFQNGTNVIAVEVHQIEAGSSDLSFNLELIGLDNDPSLYREPYLQMATPNSITIKWKTDVPTDSRVNYGSSVGALTNTTDSSTLTVNHEVVIAGLNPDSKYYYSIGNSSIELIGGTSDYFFNTSPIAGTSTPTRIWVVGDAGTGRQYQFDVRDAYLNYINATDKSDLWLMLGDNAYEHGREADYHMGLFMVYQSIMRNTVSFPGSGNHEFYGETSATTETGTYYDVFAIPKNGESGGVPSGTESYYSFDYGNIHFIHLESYELSRDSTAAMGTWLKSDLQNSTAKWTIVYWHYAPYSKVDHDSDDPNDHSGRQIDMRENMNPILEQYGVDLVLGAHGHGYERSYLIDGHYGYSTSLTPAMILDGSSGNADLTSAYTKPESGTPHSGTVYLVLGSSGKLGSIIGTGHPAMFTTITDYLGSVIIDINGDTLESKFLNELGVVQDQFHIVKTTPVSSNELPIENIEIELAPNPAKGLVRIRLLGKNLPPYANLEIYDLAGKLVLKNRLSFGAGGGHVDTSHLASGTYTVRVITANSQHERKLVIID